MAAHGRDSWMAMCARGGVGAAQERGLLFRGWRWRAGETARWRCVLGLVVGGRERGSVFGGWCWDTGEGGQNRGLILGARGEAQARKHDGGVCYA